MKSHPTNNGPSYVKVLVLAILGLWLVCAAANAEFRFPMPEFESGYKQPHVEMPMPARYYPVLDTVVLAASLILSAYLVMVRRSRAGLFALAVASVLYFGFWRKGCVCPVGSLQNVLAALLDPAVGLPWLVLVFFVLPLLAALFWGRVFCAGVCPLGAVQELVAIRPVQLGKPLEAVLGLGAYLYLGLVVLGMTTNTGYLICRYDPFIGFFRQGASFNMLLVGGIFLVLGVFIGRPYCRFLCPYGVLLRWMSMFSKWHAKIPPTACIQCRLCEASCPYGAIEMPTPEERPLSRREGARRVGWLLVAAPLIMGLGAGAGYLSHGFLSKLHPKVQLAERISGEERGEFKDRTIDSDAFHAGKQTPQQLYAEANAIQSSFAIGALCLGAFMGLVVVGKLVRFSRVRGRVDYEMDRGACLSCGRCFAYCPVEKGNCPTEEDHAHS